MATRANENEAVPRERLGGIVLCGGQSRRMGMPKLALPFGPETMLQRVVRLLGEVVSSIVVVAAQDQTLPELPSTVRVARDERPQRGPLEGLRAGLAALPKEIELAYATSCDVPLLRPAFVRRVIGLVGQHDAAAPFADGFYHPLSAVYRPGLLPVIDELLAADRLRPLFLFEQVRTRRIEADELREVDPQLDTLKNLNEPHDYLAALAAAGFEIDPTVAAALARQ